MVFRGSHNEIIGILEIKNYDHISLFFVKKDFHNKGIGQKLFEYYINTITKGNSVLISL